MEKTKSILIIRWIASIISILMVAFVLLFFIGSMFEGQDKQSAGLDAYTILTFVVWGIGLASLILAIWKPGIGGLISFFSFITFNILVAANPNPEAGYALILLIFLIPSILFLWLWWMKKSGK